MRTEQVELRRSLHAYVSDLALSVMNAPSAHGWSEVEGSLAFFDVSGFTKLTERLARLGRSGAEHINDVLNTVFRGLINGVFRHGGDVLEFGGDAMVVLFSGHDHERRAAAAAAEMFRFMADDGRITTPLGDARLRMSCGMASGAQAFYLLGTTRRALVVAGPTSTLMAQLEGAANAGEALIDARLAAALPSSWITRRHSDDALKLNLGRVPMNGVPTSMLRDDAGDSEGHTAMLLPRQFGSLLEGTHRAGELKQVAMSFIRLNGTDELLADEGVDGVHRLLADITEIVDRAAAELDVCWLETQAEANSVRWTLVSGAPTATERDGERLLRVLRRIADETPVPLRIGANLGVVFVGDMGHPQRCTYIVMGDATNLAARLMAKAAPGEIIAGERLYNTCPDRFEFTPLEPFLVKGKKAPVRAFLVEGLAAENLTGGVHHSDATLTPMVGRDEELAQLLRAIRDGGFVELVGEAGVGKSRLWQEARRVTDSRRWYVMRAEPHEVGSLYLPFRRLIRFAAGIDPNDDAVVVGASIAALVAQVAPVLLPWLPLIATVVGADVPTTDEVEALDPTFRADRVRLAVAELVLVLTGPDSVIVFEDVHWIDEASRALVDVLGGLLGSHTAFVLTRRPEGWSPSPVTTIQLAPIDSEYADELLLRELPASAASDATLARLRESAEGNPLYLIELARSVATHSTVADAAYPETVERVLAARIDQLPVIGRELIRDASVLGSTMSRDFASRVLERDDLEDARTWERELGDLVMLGEQTVRFRHDLVRVAAYEGLSVRRRRALHQRAGDVIEAWGESVPLPDPVAALAFHATGSGMPERIVRWNREAAEAAIAKGAMEVAETLLGDVLVAQRQIGAVAADCCTTHRRLAYAAERAGHPETALGALAHAARLAGARDQAVIAEDRSRLQEKLGRYRAALVTTARALKSCPDPHVGGHLRLSRATIRNRLGQWKKCLELCRTLLKDFEHSDDLRLLAQAHLLAEWCCMSLGLPERAEHERVAFSLLTELDDSIGLANLLLNRGESAWRESRAIDALADFRMSSEHYQRAGDVLGAALADNNVAEILTLQSHLDAATRLLQRARRVTQAASYPMGAFAALSGLSRIAAWQGRVDEGLGLQSEALAGFRELQADDLVVDSLVRIVELHLLAGDASTALAAADEAARALKRLGDAAVVPATLARLRARALLLDGREQEARASFEIALDHATADGFIYEIALASMGIARMDNDDARISISLAQLGDLGVVAPPPGS
ncbi:MAG: adenylate/guanylate cyclase domain-containing protein [Ilumatobacteraceae bacterium]